MTYRLLADAVALFHLAFVVFVVIGGLLVLRWPKLAWLHLPCAAWGVLIELEGWICPLTPLENWFRAQGGGGGYRGGFVDHYVLPVLYPAGLTSGFRYVLGAIVLAVNGLVYGRVLLNRRRGGR